MPLPTPRRNEGHDKFISRCVARLKRDGEFESDSQRRAVCERQWQESDEEDNMARIEIDGIVGLDVLASDVREQLNNAGDEVELLISSPGGSVYEGLAIYNAIRDFRRNGGKVTARVVGLAASMSTYIPLAADTVRIEDNAVWMIHNPRMLAMGDQRDMQKAFDILTGVTSVLSKAYVKKTGKEKDEILTMMEEETYLYGEEIIDAGFADELEPAGEGAEDRSEAVAVAKTAVSDMEEKLRQQQSDSELNQAAALLKEQPAAEDRTGVAGKNEPASDAGNKREVPMDREQLKKEHPDLYAQLEKEFHEAGVKAERARVSKLRSYIEAAPDNTKVAEVVNTAIADGSTKDDVEAKLQVALMQGQGLAGENAPSVETEEETDTLSDEERSIMDHFGVSKDEYLAANKGA
jgi:ATP-dependent protease ClpP protease subunit